MEEKDKRVSQFSEHHYPHITPVLTINNARLSQAAH